MNKQVRQEIVNAYIECGLKAFKVPEQMKLLRVRNATQARYAVMYLLTQRFHEMSAKDGFGLKHLGNMVAQALNRSKGYDHATVLNGLRSIDNYMTSPDRVSKEFRENYTTLLKLIQQARPYDARPAYNYRENRKLHNAIRNKAIWNANRYVTI
jgi:hypothetical protein